MSRQDNINNSREEYNHDSDVSGVHRTQGLTSLALAGIFSTAIPNSPILMTLGSTILAINGVGDLATGKHHYCFVKGYEYIRDRFKKSGECKL